jgi:hypothetical protein
MMHQRAVITNLKFTYADQRKKLIGLSKYYQHRNDKLGASHVRQYDERGNRVQRWVNGGLGDHFREVTDTCLSYGTSGMKRDVGSRLLVIAPEVNFMDALPQERRADVLKELTEYTLENWFDRMDLPTAEYSYVLHEGKSAKNRPDGREKDAVNATQTYLHTHVVLAPTVQGIDGRENYKVYDRHISMLHEAGREAMEHLWERELGSECLAQLNAELAQREQHYKERDIEYAEKFFVEAEKERQAQQLENTLEDEERVYGFD